MFRLFSFVPFLLCTGSFRSIAADEVCHAEGVCFASETKANEYYSKGVYIPIDFGEDQSIAGENWKATLENLEKAKKYMKVSSRVTSQIGYLSHPFVPNFEGGG